MNAETPPQAGARPEFVLLTEVSEPEADGVLNELYADIKQVLGVSLVNALFRALGPFPAYLQQVWTGLRPNTLSPSFDTGANQIRAEAVRLISHFPAFGCDVPLLGRLGYLPGDIEHLRAGMAAFHYINPQLLLWVAAVRAAREQELGQSAVPQGLTEPVAGRPAPLHLIPPGTAPPEVAIRYYWLQRLLAAPVVNSDFQFLGGFPTYFYHIFPHLQDLILTQGFMEAANSLATLATRLSGHLPYRVRLEPVEPEADQRLDLFFGLLPRLTLLSASINRRLGCAHQYYMR